ncbi:hypothetical protein [Nocardioides stalactiti]|uniref:hypothetical protein n=1 Tax=Nocardioides stalactiti TaxID=2755356 RepID=UPI0015FFB7FD|nr:hypothetical protein [Nocardioides stalactiti]
MPWLIGAIANTIIGAAYLMIFATILRPLVRGRQLRSNLLASATAAIFLTCAVHHGSHVVHMVLPSFGIADGAGMAMREAWTWPAAGWDIVGALVAVYYFSLRRGYGALIQGAELFTDLQKREQQALELNDNVLQGLVVARMSLDLDQREKATAALDAAILSASGMITDLIGSEYRSADAGLLRTSAAIVDPTSGDSAQTQETGA